MLANLDPLGGARMVDVTPREPTHRRALARCRVSMLPETTTKVANNAITKGDVLAAARIAGIQAAKRTHELIPFCHPLGIENCQVEIEHPRGNEIIVRCTVSVHHRTGVEMEALTGASVAALTIYDMCKALSHDIQVRHVRLLAKSGGRRAFARAVRS